MKRRAFIGTSLAAIVATGVKTSLIHAHEPSPQTLLENFTRKFNFEPSITCWSDTFFTLLHQETSKSLQAVGYRFAESHIYAIPKLNLVFVPWELNNDDLGCLDSCFLFFEKRPDGQWQHIKTLNQYEINTILQLGDIISAKSNTDLLSDFLLPRYSTAHWPNSYGTQQGRVEMIIRVNGEGVQSSVQVWGEQQLLCQESYNLSKPPSMVV